MANRVQLTTDGNHIYLNAIENYMGGNVDYARRAVLAELELLTIENVEN